MAINKPLIISSRCLRTKIRFECTEKKENQEQIKAYDNRKYFPQILGRAAAKIEMEIHLEKNFCF